MLDQFSATIEKLYAAAADASLWTEALGAVEQLSGSAGVVVNLVDRADPASSVLLNSPGIFELLDGSQVDEYNREVLPYCPRIQWGIDHPTAGVVCDYMILSEAEMSRNLAYDWYGRHGLRYFVGSPLIETGRYSMMWSFQRTPGQGHAQSADIELFQLLRPHVARALCLAEQLGTLEQAHQFELAILDTLPSAIFALDANGRILLMNAEAERLLREGDAFVVSRGRLRSGLAPQRTQFDCLLQAAIAGEQPKPLGGWLRLERASGRKAVSVFVAPVLGFEGLIGTFAAKAVVFATDPTETSGVDERALQELFGLSAAEARLASALSSGHSVESAGALLGIQEATVRSELKSIFRKLGVSRQQDLVRLLTSVAMMPVLPL